MGGEEGVGGPQQQGEDHGGDDGRDPSRHLKLNLSKLSDNRRDHETDAGGFQQETEGVGADQGGQAKSQVNMRKSKIARLSFSQIKS